MSSNDRFSVTRADTPPEYHALTTDTTLQRTVRSATTAAGQQPAPVIHLKPSLKVAVHQSMLFPRLRICSVVADATSPVNLNLHRHIPSPDAQTSPDIVITPPPYQFLNETSLQKSYCAESLRKSLKAANARYNAACPHNSTLPRGCSCFQPLSSHKPMNKRTLQHTYRACAFLAAQKLSRMLRSPSAELVALLKPTPLIWADPAQPILSRICQFASVTVYISSAPCTVPHLVITDASPIDDSAASNNMVPQKNADNNNLLSPYYQPRVVAYEGEEWYTLEDAGFGFIDELNFTFNDDIVLPLPDLTEIPTPITPSPSSPCSGNEEPPTVSCDFITGHPEEASTLSPTSSPRVPILLVKGDAMPAFYELPSSIELEALLSPEGFRSWMTGGFEF
ncbi:hypothetical protein K488DRAFT_81724 [Vararia minispora EC-137]|uniref:Uncharacterized protein n=1 Tax=Vararia minispora EC-137 TaxID=1314806 RepID=A0ACB8QXT1_9AGAM|nr:hypothetical protein K488DRAFT_81724 [Vararia minispora EC-137]